MTLLQVLLWLPALAAGFLVVLRYKAWRESKSPEARHSFSNTLALLSLVLVVSGFTYTMMLQPQLSWSHYHLSDLP